MLSRSAMTASVAELRRSEFLAARAQRCCVSEGGKLKVGFVRVAVIYAPRG